MTIDQDQGSDIEIPVVEIARGWTVDKIATLDDCDDAFAYLTGALCSIEARIDEAVEAGQNKGDAFRRLKAAARWKRAALSIVNTKRGRIARADRATTQASADRALLDEIKRQAPQAFFAALSVLQAKKDEAA